MAHPGAIELPGGKLMVLFAGEQPSFDNENTDASHNAPRNLGLVIVSATVNETVFSGDGSVQTGGFFSYCAPRAHTHAASALATCVRSAAPNPPRPARCARVERALLP